MVDLLIFWLKPARSPAACGGLDFVKSVFLASAMKNTQAGGKALRCDRR